MSMSFVPQPGSQLLGKYRVERVLGAGGMGVVVAATHLELGESVAIKLLLPEAAANPDIVRRFLREARAAARLRGEHVARVLDVGSTPDGVPYLVMEYLDGSDLAAVLQRAGRLAPAEAVDYVLQACEALAEAHAASIVHRDIKPANLFVTRHLGGSPLVKVLDFGISKIEMPDGGLTRTQTVMGTPSYMSPEQMRSARDVDARTDVWALGIVLYECLSGRLPFQADSYAGLVLEVVHGRIPPLEVPVPTGLARVIERCLAKDGSLRYANAAELALALSPYAGDARSASLIVDRVRGIARPREALPDPRAHARAMPTTLGSGSAELVASGRPRRAVRTLAALASLILVGVAITWRVGTSGSRATDAPASQPAVMPTTAPTVDAGRANAPADAAMASTIDAPAGPAPSPPAEASPPRAAVQLPSNAAAGPTTHPHTARAVRSSRELASPKLVHAEHPAPPAPRAPVQQASPPSSPTPPAPPPAFDPYKTPDER